MRFYHCKGKWEIGNICKKTQRFMDKSTSCLVYKQTIMLYFDYILLLTESSTQREIGKLQTLQNRAVKTVFDE